MIPLKTEYGMSGQEMKGVERRRALDLVGRGLCGLTLTGRPSAV